MFSRVRIAGWTPSLMAAFSAGRPKRVPPHGVQDVEAPHPEVAGVHVADQVVAHVPHVHLAAGVRQHLQHVLLRCVGPGVGARNRPAFSQRSCQVASRDFGTYRSLSFMVAARLRAGRTSYPPRGSDATFHLFDREPNPMAPPVVTIRDIAAHENQEVELRGLALQQAVAAASSTSSRSGTAPASSRRWSSRATSRPSLRRGGPHRPGDEPRSSAAW